jgi:hypothetical protein
MFFLENERGLQEYTVRYIDVQKDSETLLLDTVFNISLIGNLALKFQKNAKRT